MKGSDTHKSGMNGGRRVSFERRLFSYTNFIPERRSGQDRRDIFERRQFSYTGFIPERRSGKDRRNIVPLCRYAPPRRFASAKKDGVATPAPAFDR
jgi:hypothetical protein